MKFSAILPTYNRKPFLRQHLDSLAAQTRQPDELIIGDDQSTDGTVEAIKEFAAHAPFPVRWYRNERNEGASRNAERAIEQCSGDIVVICDDDDISLPDRLKKIEGEFAKSPEVGLVLSNSDLVDQTLHPIDMTLWDAHKFTSRQAAAVCADPICTLAKHFIGYGHVTAFRNTLKSYILPFPRRLPPSVFFDVWLTLVLASLADLVCIPESLVLHRLHDRQIGGVRTVTASKERMAERKSHEREKMGAFAPFVQEVSDRVSAQTDTPRSRRNVASLVAWADHLRMQSRLSAGKSYRLLPIVRALFSGRYHRYSRGFLTAARDLLILQ